jgi:hypothetical protein
VVALLGLLGPARTATAQRSHDRVLRLSLPHVNSFLLRPVGEPDTKVNTGFWGLGIGMLFRHSQTQYVGVTASIVFDIPAPVPAPIDFEGEYELMNAYALDLTNRHVRGRFSLGYGISWNSREWKLENYDEPAPPAREPTAVRSSSLGLSVPLGYTLDDRFALGLIYRPSVYRLGSDAGFVYEHVISLEIAWNVTLP